MRELQVDAVHHGYTEYQYLLSTKQSRLAPRQRRQSPGEAFDSNFIPSMNQEPSLTSAPDPPDVPNFHIQSEHPTPSLRRASPDPGLDNFEDEERNGLEIASAALGQPERVGEVPFYAGRENKSMRQRKN